MGSQVLDEEGEIGSMASKEGERVSRRWESSQELARDWWAVRGLGGLLMVAAIVTVKV